MGQAGRRRESSGRQVSVVGCRVGRRGGAAGSAAPASPLPGAARARRVPRFAALAVRTAGPSERRPPRRQFRVRGRRTGLHLPESIARVRRGLGALAGCRIGAAGYWWSGCRPGQRACVGAAASLRRGFRAPAHPAGARAGRGAGLAEQQTRERGQVHGQHATRPRPAAPAAARRDGHLGERRPGLALALVLALAQRVQDEAHRASLPRHGETIRRPGAPSAASSTTCVCLPAMPSTVSRCCALEILHEPRELRVVDVAAAVAAGRPCLREAPAQPAHVLAAHAGDERLRHRHLRSPQDQELAVPVARGRAIGTSRDAPPSSSARGRLSISRSDDLVRAADVVDRASGSPGGSARSCANVPRWTGTPGPGARPGRRRGPAPASYVAPHRRTASRTRPRSSCRARAREQPSSETLRRAAQARRPPARGGAAASHRGSRRRCAGRARRGGRLRVPATGHEPRRRRAQRPRRPPPRRPAEPRRRHRPPVDLGRRLRTSSAPTRCSSLRERAEQRTVADHVDDARNATAQPVDLGSAAGVNTSAVAPATRMRCRT